MNDEIPKTQAPKHDVVEVRGQEGLVGDEVIVHHRVVGMLDVAQEQHQQANAHDDRDPEVRRVPEVRIVASGSHGGEQERDGARVQRNALEVDVARRQRH